MTQEEKQLLFKDLCARVPYKPKVKVLHVWNEDKEIEEDIVDTIYCVLPDGYINTGTIDSDIPLENVILYLRPMSSITKKENEEFTKLCYTYYEPKVNGVVDLPYGAGYDWLLEHHFDYRNLIKKGLALEAPKDMYKTE